MSQHSSFKRDLDLLAEAYGAIGAAHTFQDFGSAQQAANQMREEDGEDKTGQLSDRDLLDTVEKKGTAGDRLLDAAKKRLDDGESLTPHERDALARDAYEGEEDDLSWMKSHLTDKVPNVDQNGGEDDSWMKSHLTTKVPNVQ